jgi:hypothetical protein
LRTLDCARRATKSRRARCRGRIMLRTSAVLARSYCAKGLAGPQPLLPVGRGRCRRWRCWRWGTAVARFVAGAVGLAGLATRTRAGADAGLSRAGSADRPRLVRARCNSGHGRARRCCSHELLGLTTPALRRGAADDGLARGGDVGGVTAPAKVDLADASLDEISVLVAGVARRLAETSVEGQRLAGHAIRIAVELLNCGAVRAPQRTDEETHDSSHETHGLGLCRPMVGIELSRTKRADCRGHAAAIRLPLGIS